MLFFVVMTTYIQNKQYCLYSEFISRRIWYVASLGFLRDHCKGNNCALFKMRPFHLEVSTSIKGNILLTWRMCMIFIRVDFLFCLCIIPQ